MLQPDLNPILDEGAPTSTGGIRNAARLCVALGIALNLDEPRDVYLHGWGDRCADAKIIKYSWTITIQDVNDLPTSFIFDLVDGDSP